MSEFFAGIYLGALLVTLVLKRISVPKHLKKPHCAECDEWVRLVETTKKNLKELNKR